MIWPSFHYVRRDRHVRVKSGGWHHGQAIQVPPGHGDSGWRESTSDEGSEIQRMPR